MKMVFDDPQLSFQLLRLAGSSVWHGADIGECLSTAYRIKEDDLETWYAEWFRTAQRLHQFADGCLKAGHDLSAGETFLRTANYYRAAEFYLHGNPKDPRIVDLSHRSKECFSEALRLSGIAVERLEIPYDDTTLPGYFYRAGEPGEVRPTLIVQTGFDGTIVELHGPAVAATARGINCLSFEGPGQGSVIRMQGLPFRPDWEKVVTPVVDHALTLPEVDPDKIALMGISFGGYLAPRAAAFEHRLAALIANGGVYDFMGSRMPADLSRDETIAYVRAHMDEVNQQMEEQATESLLMRWSMDNSMYTLGASSPAEAFLKGLQYNLEGIAEKIQCPTLVIDVQNEVALKGEAEKLFDALTCPKTFMFFTAAESAEEHCQMGATLFSNARVFNWLQETLQ